MQIEHACAARAHIRKCADGGDAIAFNAKGLNRRRCCDAGIDRATVNDHRLAAALARARPSHRRQCGLSQTPPCPMHARTPSLSAADLKFASLVVADTERISNP